MYLRCKMPQSFRVPGWRGVCHIQMWSPGSLGHFHPSQLKGERDAQMVFLAGLEVLLSTSVHGLSQ